MKFDVVIGNPPYQIEDGGFGASASPIYQLFVEQAFKLKPRYVSMIIPSRWFAGGKGLTSFRNKMLESTNFRQLTDYPNAAQLFPGVDISGGVCYFLWDEKYNGECEVQTILDEQVVSISSRFLGEHGDVFVRFNEALPIIKKAEAERIKNGSLEDVVLAVNPFSLVTNFKGYTEKATKNSIMLQTKDGLKYIGRNQIKSSVELIDKWKVIIAAAYGERGSYPYLITGKPRVLPPGSACTQTYLVAGYFDTQVAAENYDKYLRTRFVRFLVGLLKNTQHLSKGKFKFVPLLDMNQSWTDEKLFKKFGITDSEITFIESLIREMPGEK